MATTEDLVLDDDGVPILTDSIEPEANAGTTELPDRQLATMSVNDTIRATLGSAAVRHRLDEIAGELTDHFRGQIEQLLRPAIEQVVTEVMDDSRNATFAAIREQLDARLPAMLAEALQDAMDENS